MWKNDVIYGLTGFLVGISLVANFVIIHTKNEQIEQHKEKISILEDKLEESREYIGYWGDEYWHRCKEFEKTQIVNFIDKGDFE